MVETRYSYQIIFYRRLKWTLAAIALACSVVIAFLFAVPFYEPSAGISYQSSPHPSPPPPALSTSPPQALQRGIPYKGTPMAGCGYSWGNPEECEKIAQQYGYQRYPSMSTPTPSTSMPPPPSQPAQQTPPSQPAQQNHTQVGHDSAWHISQIASILPLFIFPLTCLSTFFAWRAERRATQKHSLELKKMELEIVRLEGN